MLRAAHHEQFLADQRLAVKQAKIVRKVAVELGPAGPRYLEAMLGAAGAASSRPLAGGGGQHEVDMPSGRGPSPSALTVASSWPSDFARTHGTAAAAAAVLKTPPDTAQLAAILAPQELSPDTSDPHRNDRAEARIAAARADQAAQPSAPAPQQQQQQQQQQPISPQPSPQPSKEPRHEHRQPAHQQHNQQPHFNDGNGSEYSIGDDEIAHALDHAADSGDTSPVAVSGAQQEVTRLAPQPPSPAGGGVATQTSSPSPSTTPFPESSLPCSRFDSFHAPLLVAVAELASLLPIPSSIVLSDQHALQLADTARVPVLGFIVSGLQATTHMLWRHLSDGTVSDSAQVSQCLLATSPEYATYVPQEGLHILFDWVGGLSLRATRVQIAYCFYLGAERIGDIMILPAQDSEPEPASPQQRMSSSSSSSSSSASPVALQAMLAQQRLIDGDAHEGFTLVVEVQRITGSQPGDLRSVGWTAVPLFRRLLSDLKSSAAAPAHAASSPPEASSGYAPFGTHLRLPLHRPPLPPPQLISSIARASSAHLASSGGGCLYMRMMTHAQLSAVVDGALSTLERTPLLHELHRQLLDVADESRTQMGPLDSQLTSSEAQQQRHAAAAQEAATAALELQQLAGVLDGRGMGRMANEADVLVSMAALAPAYSHVDLYEPPHWGATRGDGAADASAERSSAQQAAPAQAPLVRHRESSTRSGGIGTISAASDGGTGGLPPPLVVVGTADFPFATGGDDAGPPSGPLTSPASSSSLSALPPPGPVPPPPVNTPALGPVSVLPSSALGSSVDMLPALDEIFAAHAASSVGTPTPPVHMTQQSLPLGATAGALAHLPMVPATSASTWVRTAEPLLTASSPPAAGASTQAALAASASPSIRELQPLALQLISCSLNPSDYLAAPLLAPVRLLLSMQVAHQQQRQQGSVQRDSSPSRDRAMAAGNGVPSGGVGSNDISSSWTHSSLELPAVMPSLPDPDNPHLGLRVYAWPAGAHTAVVRPDAPPIVVWPLLPLSLPCSSSTAAAQPGEADGGAHALDPPATHPSQLTLHIAAVPDGDGGSTARAIGDSSPGSPLLLSHVPLVYLSQAFEAVLQPAIEASHGVGVAGAALDDVASRRGAAYTLEQVIDHLFLPHAGSGLPLTEPGEVGETIGVGLELPLESQLPVKLELFEVAEGPSSTSSATRGSAGVLQGPLPLPAACTVLLRLVTSPATMLHLLTLGPLLVESSSGAASDARSGRGSSHEIDNAERQHSHAPRAQERPPPIPRGNSVVSEGGASSTGATLNSSWVDAASTSAALRSGAVPSRGASAPLSTGALIHSSTDGSDGGGGGTPSYGPPAGFGPRVPSATLSELLLPDHSAHSKSSSSSVAAASSPSSSPLQQSSPIRPVGAMSTGARDAGMREERLPHVAPPIASAVGSSFASVSRGAPAVVVSDMAVSSHGGASALLRPVPPLEMHEVGVLRDPDAPVPPSLLPTPLSVINPFVSGSSISPSAQYAETSLPAAVRSLSSAKSAALHSTGTMSPAEGAFSSAAGATGPALGQAQQLLQDGGHTGTESGSTTTPFSGGGTSEPPHTRFGRSSGEPSSREGGAGTSSSLNRTSSPSASPSEKRATSSSSSRPDDRLDSPWSITTGRASASSSSSSSIGDVRRGRGRPHRNLLSIRPPPATTSGDEQLDYVATGRGTSSDPSTRGGYLRTSASANASNPSSGTTPSHADGVPSPLPDLPVPSSGDEHVGDGAAAPIARHAVDRRTLGQSSAAVGTEVAGDLPLPDREDPDVAWIDSDALAAPSAAFNIESGQVWGDRRHVSSRSDAFDVYVDAARMLPDNVSLSKVTLRVLTPSLAPAGPPLQAVCALDSTVTSPRYGLSARFVNAGDLASDGGTKSGARSPIFCVPYDPHELAGHAGCTLTFRVDALDVRTGEQVIVGLAVLNLFAHLSSDAGSQPGLVRVGARGDTTGIADGDDTWAPSRLQLRETRPLPGGLALNAGAFQLPLFALPGPPPSAVPFGVDSLAGIPRVPCATLLVRLVHVPASRRPLTFPATPAPSYSAGSYDSSRSRPSSVEALLYARRADSVSDERCAPTVRGVIRAMQEEQLLLAGGGGIGGGGPAARDRAMVPVPPRGPLLAPPPAGSDSVSLLRWMSATLSRAPDASLRLLDLSRITRYEPSVGLQVCVDAVVALASPTSPTASHATSCALKVLHYLWPPPPGGAAVSSPSKPPARAHHHRDAQPLPPPHLCALLASSSSSSSSASTADAAPGGAADDGGGGGGAGSGAGSVAFTARHDWNSPMALQRFVGPPHVHATPPAARPPASSSDADAAAAAASDSCPPPGLCVVFEVRALHRSLFGGFNVLPVGWGVLPALELSPRGAGYIHGGGFVVPLFEGSPSHAQLGAVTSARTPGDVLAGLTAPDSPHHAAWAKRGEVLLVRLGDPHVSIAARPPAPPGAPPALHSSPSPSPLSTGGPPYSLVHAGAPGGTPVWEQCCLASKGADGLLAQAQALATARQLHALLPPAGGRTAPQPLWLPAGLDASAARMLASIDVSQGGSMVARLVPRSQRGGAPGQELVLNRAFSKAVGVPLAAMLPSASSPGGGGEPGSASGRATPDGEEARGGGQA